MNDKKFRLSSETVLQYQIIKNDTGLNENEVVDLLNKLYEENGKLRKENKDLNDIEWEKFKRKYHLE